MNRRTFFGAIAGVGVAAVVPIEIGERAIPAGSLPTAFRDDAWWVLRVGDHILVTGDTQPWTITEVVTYQ